MLWIVLRIGLRLGNANFNGSRKHKFVGVSFESIFDGSYCCFVIVNLPEISTTSPIRCHTKLIFQLKSRKTIIDYSLCYTLHPMTNTVTITYCARWVLD